MSILLLCLLGLSSISSAVETGAKCRVASYTLEFPGQYPRNPYGVNDQVNDHEECAKICTQDTKCKSATFSKVYGCEFSNTTKELNPAEFVIGEPNIIYEITVSPDGSTTETSVKDEAVYITGIKCFEFNEKPDEVVETTTPTSRVDDEYRCGIGAKPKQELEVPQEIDLGSRIIGGENSLIAAWPWLGSMQTKYAQSGDTPYQRGHRCGANLIRVSTKTDKTDIIVTAAHCLNKKKVKDPVPTDSISFRFGENNLAKDEPRTEQTSDSQKIIIHEDYDPNTHMNDIGVVILKDPIVFKRGAQPICISSSKVNEKKKCIAAGWGTDEKGTVPASLKEVVLPLVNSGRCDLFFKANIDEDTKLCAGFTRREAKKDACAGDSGGPLMCTIGNSKQFNLEGMTSFGAECGRDTGSYPGVYTRVSAYCDWIHEKICKESTIPGHDAPRFCDPKIRCKN